METLRSPDIDSRQRSLAYAGYRQAVAALLPELERQAEVPDGNVHGDGLRYMLRSNRFELPSQLTFFQPFDPAKTPVVLVHGLMSTPRMWVPVLKGLLADRDIRESYQFWFFSYPTGQPIPFTAL